MRGRGGISTQLINLEEKLQKWKTSESGSGKGNFLYQDPGEEKFLYQDPGKEKFLYQDPGKETFLDRDPGKEKFL